MGEEQHLDLQLQRRERRAQLVRRDREEFVPRADRVDGLAIEQLALELRARPLGDVARDRDDAAATDANELQRDLDRHRPRSLRRNFVSSVSERCVSFESGASSSRKLSRRARP